MSQSAGLDSSIVTHYGGAARKPLAPIYTVTASHDYFCERKLMHFRSSISLMIRAKMAIPASKCVNLSGNGAFDMSDFRIEMAPCFGMTVTTIVSNNVIVAIYLRAVGKVGSVRRPKCEVTMQSLRNLAGGKVSRSHAR